MCFRKSLATVYGISPVKVDCSGVEIHCTLSHNTNHTLLTFCVYFVWFCSTFEDNLSLEDNEDTSAVAAFRFPTIFKGHNYFLRNRGGGITLLNTRMQASGKLLFDSNVAVFGGGIAMDDRCLVRHTNVAL